MKKNMKTHEKRVLQNRFKVMRMLPERTDVAS